MKFVAAFVAIFLISAHSFAAPLPIPVDLSLSDPEKAALLQGKVVTHNNTEGHLGGMGFVIIKEPTWKVWQVITDYPKYPEFMPRNTLAKVLRSEENAVILETHYKSSWPMPNIWSQSRLQKNTSDADRLTLMWKAEKTNLKLNEGSWTLRPLQDSTLIIYQNSFEIAWVPQHLAKNSSRKSIARILDAVQTRIQSPRYSEYPDQFTEIWRLEADAAKHR